MSKVVFLHSAGGILFDGDKVLLIHWEAPRSSYDFPKGGIEPGESPEQASVREVREETGYSTRVVDYVGQTHYAYDWKDGNRHDKTVDYFLHEITGEPAALPRRERFETFENVWVTIDEAMRILTRDTDKELLQKAITVRDGRSS